MEIFPIDAGWGGSTKTKGPSEPTSSPSRPSSSVRTGELWRSLAAERGAGGAAGRERVVQAPGGRAWPVALLRDARPESGSEAWSSGGRVRQLDAELELRGVVGSGERLVAGREGGNG